MFLKCTKLAILTIKVGTTQENKSKCFQTNEVKDELQPFTVAVAEWAVHQTAEQEDGGSNPSIPPLLKYACGEGDWSLCWHYTLTKVSQQR